MSLSSFRKRLEPFCGDAARHFDKPFTVGDFSYATDAVIAVRVPRLADVPVLRSHPDVSIIPFPMLPVPLALSVPVPPLPEREWTHCAECAALLSTKDPEGSSGFLKAVREAASRECPYCRGTGRTEKSQPFKLPWCNVTVDAARLRPIKLFLPNARLCKDPLPVNVGSTKYKAMFHAMGFVFDGGGCGVLMPFNPQ